MTTRTQLTIGIIMSLIVFPFLIVQAQSAGEVVQPSAEQAAATEASAPAANETAVVVEEPAAEVTAPEQESTPAVEPAQETDAAPEEVSADVPAAEGEVLGESDTAGETSAPMEPATTSQQAELVIDPAASSTADSDLSVDEEATSTPPVEEPKPVEEPYVLQPAVTLHVNDSSITADVDLQNLTCKSCDKVLPELDVVAYYTPWYPNDGPWRHITRLNRAQENSKSRSATSPTGVRAR